MVETLKSAGEQGVAKAREIDSKYHVIDKAQGGLKSAADKARELNEKHHISDKAGAAVASGWAAFQKRVNGPGPTPSR